MRQLHPAHHERAGTANIVTTRAAPPKPSSASLIDLLRPYWLWIGVLIVLTMLANGLSLLVPKLIAGAIDSYGAGHFNAGSLATEFFVAAGGVFVFTYFQSLVQTFASEPWRGICAPS